MPQQRLSKQPLLAKANGRRPAERSRTRWTDCIKDLGWICLGLRPSKMMEVMDDSEVWPLNLAAARATLTKKRVMKKEEEEKMVAP